MRKDSSLTAQQRADVLALFAGGHGRDAVARHLGVSPTAVRALYDRWRIHGEEVLLSRPTTRRYSFELKREIIQRHLAGETKIALAQIFELSSPKLIERWMRLYRTEGEEGLRPKQRGRPPTDPAAPEAEAAERDRLRRENALLRAEVAYLGKLRAVTGPRRR